jgi:hypothetical protein
VPRIQIPELSRFDVLTGAAVAAPIVLLPLVSRYRSEGTLHPDTNWWLLVVGWIAASAAFAVVLKLLRAEPPPIATESAPDDRIFRWGERGRRAAPAVDLAILLFTVGLLAMVWLGGLPVERQAPALAGLVILSILALLHIIRIPFRRAFAQLEVTECGIILRRGAAQGRAVTLGWDEIDRIVFVSPWADGAVLVFTTRAGESLRFALTEALGGFGRMRTEARVHEVLGAVGGATSRAGWELTGPRRQNAGALFHGMNWRLTRRTEAPAAPR